jgi:spore germination cell wall hydrolase CwlJ-like protein
VRLTPDDTLLAVTCWQEAEGESFKGKVMVVEAMLNRCRRHIFSDGTIAGTVALRKQFSAYNDDPLDNARFIQSLRLDDSNPIVKECQRAVQDAKAGTVFANGATHYYSGPVPYWAASMKVVATEGKHTFLA